MDPFFNLAYPGKFVIDVIIDKTRGLMFDSTHHPTGLQKAFCKIGTHVRPFVLTDGQCWNPRLGTSQCDADRWIYPRQGWNLQKISYLDKMTVGIVYKSIVSNMKTEKRIKILHHLPVYVQVQISAAFPTRRRCLDSHVHILHIFCPSTSIHSPSLCISISGKSVIFSVKQAWA